MFEGLNWDKNYCSGNCLASVSTMLWFVQSRNGVSITIEILKTRNYCFFLMNLNRGKQKEEKERES